MPVLSNPRHERFAQYLAQGKTATEAYELAGYRPSRFNASHLADNPKVIERLQQITTKNAVKSAVTADTLMAEFEQARVLAMESKQCSAAVNATKEKSVLSGHRIERREVGAPGEFDALSDDELERAIVERLGRLGFAVSKVEGERTPDAESDTRH
jgi:phage terminase small subunit